MANDAVSAEVITPSKENVGISGSSFKPKTTPRWLLTLAASGMLLSGTWDSICSKWMNKQYLPPCKNCNARYFEGPFLQTLGMYLGELCCLLLYFADAWIAKCNKGPKHLDFPTSAASFNKKKCPVFLWMIPTTLDFIASSMISYALIFTQASTVQMLSNFNVVLTAGLTIGYLRLGLRVHHWLGVIVITMGLVIVGVYAFLHPDDDTNYDNMEWLGVLMSLCGTVLSAFQFVFEESLFRKYYASPFEAVGWMGVFGTIASVIILIIGQYAGFEDSKGNFYMMGLGRKESSYIIIACFSYILSIFFFNGFGLMVTKLGSGLLRSVLYSARTFTVWAMELAFGWNTFDGLNFSGLLVVIGGVLLYNYNSLTTSKSEDCCCSAGDSLMKKPITLCGVKNPDDLMSEENDDEKDITTASSDNDIAHCSKQEISTD